MGERQGESFRGLLLRYRGRTNLTQRELAERTGVHPRSVQDWEAGLSYPKTERVEVLVGALLEAGGFASGFELAEAQALWDAVELEAPVHRPSFDAAWFKRLLAARHVVPVVSTPTVPSGPTPRTEDWGEAPDLVTFVGRTDELALLRRWVLDEGCRLLAVLGMGGIGKTSLAAKLAEEMSPAFQYVYWRSLRDAPAPEDWLAGAIGFLSKHELAMPASMSERVAALLRQLRAARCLLVLDNYETVFEPGKPAGQYREGMQGYGRVVEAIGESAHQSCLLLSSREAPREVALLASGSVRAFALGGLGPDETQVLLTPKQLRGTPQAWTNLTTRFGGNGLALKLVGENIRELFDGDIDAFLESAGAAGPFGDIRSLLSNQVERSTAPERQVLRILAVEREPMRVASLLSLLGPSVGLGAVLEALEGLRRRSLVERADRIGAAAFSLQSAVLEYVTDRLVEDIAEEIARGEPRLLVELSVIQAQAKEYVRQTQERLIGIAILKFLAAQHAPPGVERRLIDLLENWRGTSPELQGFGPGNVVNLLRVLRGDLNGLDLADLELRQPYLAVHAENTSLAGAHLSEAVIAEPMSAIVCTALGADARYVLAGTHEGAMRMWEVAGRGLMLDALTRNGPVWSVALGADARCVATASGDGNVRLWDVGTGECVQVLKGLSRGARGVSLSGDGKRVAGCGPDGTVRIWDAATVEALHVLTGHVGEVWSVALSADGQRLASGGADGTVRVWDARIGKCIHVLSGHTAAVLSVALSADAPYVASGGADATIRLWDVATGQGLHVLSGHPAGTRAVALSASGQRLASCGLDGNARVWDVASGRCLQILTGHVGEVRGVSLSPDGRYAATGGIDGAVRIWDVLTGACLHILAGHAAAFWAIGLSGRDGRVVAGLTLDRKVRLWDTSTGECLRVFPSPSGEARCVAVSETGAHLATGGADACVRVWDTTTGDCTRVIKTGTSILSVGFAAEGGLLAGGGADGSVRVWDAGTGECLHVLLDRGPSAWTLALTRDGSVLASSPHDNTVRLWDARTGDYLGELRAETVLLAIAVSANGGRIAAGGANSSLHVWDVPSGSCIAEFSGHTGEIRSVALSADGGRAVSGSLDGTMRVWDLAAGECRATFREHPAPVWDVGLSADGRLAASASLDGTLHIWDVDRGVTTRTLRPDRLYEGMDITRLSGVTQAQRSALLSLGAWEKAARA
ncbi:MAG: NACHT domain-containing protein [Chloroflexi bacterium]|nr:NACHT domain-containing protein [Chloroflexota bacterium]